MVATYNGALESGRRRAAELGRPVLVSRTRPMDDSLDPVALFPVEPCGRGHKAFWHQPSLGRWMVGLGAAWVIAALPDEPHGSLKERYETLIRDAVIQGNEGGGPAALGGFRFDPEAPAGPEWRDFGAGYLVIPRLCYARTPAGAWVTENTVFSVEGDGRSAPAVVAEAEGHHIPGMGESISIGGEGARVRWRAAVEKGLELIRRGELEKVVLARRRRVGISAPLSMERALHRMAESNPECTIFAFARGGASFLGATPEPLLKVEGGWVESICEAGSAPRGPTPEEDRRIGEALLSDGKERWEHSLVVEGIAESLGGLCSELEWSETPVLAKLRHVQHLSTAFRGLNPFGHHVLDFVERLHPTPAVAGVPREKAMMLIREVEGLDRGWYSGPVGWIGASGEGEFTIAIRSALVRGNEALLYAGAGIVEGSDPDKEFAETGLKLQTMLSALDVTNDEA